MMMPTSPARLNDDCKLIARHLLRMAMPRIIRRAIVIGIALVLWLVICRALLSFGSGMRYDALIVVGQQAVDLLNRINPYLWWGVVALFTLVMFFVIRGWYVGSLVAGRATPVEPATLRELAGQLSADSLMVLNWAWRDREEPLTVGDLQLTLSELRHGRVSKIYLTREQQAALPAHATAPQTRVEPLAAAAKAPARPTASPAAMAPAPAQQPGPTEPSFGATPRNAPAHNPPIDRTEPGLGTSACERRTEPRLPDPDRR